MQIYLPIAEVSVNAFLLLGLGGMVGVLSGMFGVGGGFLMTPLLFFIGIPPGSSCCDRGQSDRGLVFFRRAGALQATNCRPKNGVTVLLVGRPDAGAALGCGGIQLPEIAWDKSICWSSFAMWSFWASSAG